MSVQEGDMEDVSQVSDSPLIPESKSRLLPRFAKDKKKRSKTRSRVIKDDEDTPPNDPDYSPCEDILEGESGEVSTCSTPVEEKLSSHGSTPVPVVCPSSGSICALCYCGEKSLLGQGDLTRYDPTPGFNPFRKPTLKRGSRDSFSGLSPAPDYGDRSSKSPSRSRSHDTRHSQDSSARHVESRTIEVVDELSTLGCPEIADPANIFESSGHVTAHHCCAAWSEGVTQNELYQLLCVDKAVHQGMSLKCSYCSRYGATIKCKAARCDKLYHYPCAAGSGCFQDIKSMLMLCPDHLEQAPSIGAPEELNCAVCDDMGEISDFLFCTSCGHHYHGNCLRPDVSVNPVVRAGWQCPDCKICQTCRQPGDDNKMLVCDSCDKGYHTYCLQPAIPSIPKNGWCCQSCRRCSDCGAKSICSGSSSQWRYSEEVCDSCHQQRDKGSGCPVCGKAYPEKVTREDMMQCNDCKKWVHEECEDMIDMDTYYEMGSDYLCPKCRDDTTQVEMTTTASPYSAGKLTPMVCKEPSSIEPPAPVGAEEEDKPEEKQPAKRTSASSSLESEKSFAMKGNSTDPMLFDSYAAGLKISKPKQRHVSDDTIAAVSQHVRSLIERKASAESHLGSVFGEGESQDPLGLFSSGAFQPIVSVSMLSEDEQGTLQKDNADWSKRKIPKLSDSHASPKPISKLSPTTEPSRPGAGKPGAMFGKGKPFGGKKKPVARGSKGKNQSKGKGGRRQRQGSMASHASTAVTNVPSPGGTSTTGQVSTSSNAIGARRRSRTRLRHENMLGSISATEMYRDGVDEEYGDSMHNTVVLCSADDAFTLNQDMCVVCGSFGQGPEGRLVACSQCGQCYHPYCVNLKLTKVVLRKGWRCLDCTVCEECGAADDPSHLLLCDDCDISYHTYCLKPPLQHVPKGGWKCKWCVKCNHCGTLTPGFNCDWAENYSSCGPCASLSHCPLCRRSYKDDDVIMQCSSCERWLHSACEYLYSESDIEKVLEKGYSCVFCRPKDATPPHLDLNPPQPFDSDPSSGIYLGRTRSDAEQVKEYHKDGVALTSAGLQHIQQLMQNAMGLHKKKPNVQKRKTPLQKQTEKLVAPLEIKSPMDQSGDSAAKETEQPVTKNMNNVGDDNMLPVDSQTSALPVATPESEADPITDPKLGSHATDDPQSPSSEHVDVGSTLADQAGGDATKQLLGGVQQGGIKRRRKPYRPGIGGFMVRQRGRGGIIAPKARRSRIQPGGTAVASVNTSTAGGFDTTPPKGDDVKLRASEITGECESSYIKHEMEGGITIAHQESSSAEVKDEVIPEEKCESQTSMLVSPLKLKISTLPSGQQKAKRKRRTRLIDQFPPYIQDGFFGPSVLSIARTISSQAIDLEEVDSLKNNLPVGGDSRIVLPERVKLRLDAQVASKAVEAQKKAELKQERLHARRLPSGDDDGLMIDKENDDFLGVLPDVLSFKDDELLGILSGSQGQGGQDTHESILSPSALETLVTDGLASIDGDVTSLFSDVLNHGHDGTTSNDEHGLLGDIGGLTSEQSKTTSASNARDTTSRVSASNDIDPTDAIIDHITAEHNKEEEKMLNQQKQMQQQAQVRHQQQEQSHQQQLQLHHPQQIQLQQQVQQPSFPQQDPMLASHVQATSRHMFPEAGVPSNLSPQQHNQLQVAMQQGQMQQVPMQLQQQQQANKPLPMQQQQQQQFMGVPNQGMAGMHQNAPTGMPLASQTPDHLHSPAMMVRQYSLDMNMSNAGQMDIQPSQQRVMTPSGQIVPIFSGHPSGGAHIGSRPGSGMSNPPVPQSPALVCKMENTDPSLKQPGQVTAVSSLPDLTSDSNIFEPAPPPWPLGTDLEGDTLSVNQRNILKWEKDEPLGELATISPVLYANMKHAYLKKEFPDWPTRAKQVAKLWRKATPEERAPYLQKARDNRAFLKSSRRDIGEVNEQDLLSMEFLDQEEELKPGFQPKTPSQHPQSLQSGGHVGGQQAAQMQHEARPMLQHAQQQHVQMQMKQQALVKTSMQSSSPLSSGQDYSNFVKPRPLSRDPTPKPQSPGAATSPMMPGNRSKSPFSSGVHPVSPMAGSQRPRGPWGEANFKQSFELQQQQLQGQASGQQPMMIGMGTQGWQSQQMGQHPMRMPKIESVDSSGIGSSQVMKFPQSFQANPQNITPGGSPMPISSPAKPGTLQRQGSSHDSVMGAGQEQFLLRPITPRPGMPPQLLPQVVSPVVQMNQRQMTPSPISPQAGIRAPRHKGSQPTTPQPSTATRDHFVEMATEKSVQRRMSVTETQPTVAPTATGDTSSKVATSLSQHPPATPPVSSSLEVEGVVKTEMPENAALAAGGSGIMQGTVGRPQIREVLHRHTTQRRYKLLEQQTLPGGSWAAATTTVITRPPPPYPSHSPSPSSTQGSFIYPPNVRSERFSAPKSQAMQLNESRIRAGFRPMSVIASPPFSANLTSPLLTSPTSPSPSFGVERFPTRSSASSGPTGVHPITGQAPVSGGYIELQHSKQPDPAIRREQILRAGAGLPVASSTTSQLGSSKDLKSNVSIASAKTAAPTATATTPLLTPKSEPITSKQTKASSAAVSNQETGTKTITVKTEPVDIEPSQSAAAFQQSSPATTTKATEKQASVSQSPVVDVNDDSQKTSAGVVPTSVASDHGLEKDSLSEKVTSSETNQTQVSTVATAVVATTLSSSTATAPSTADSRTEKTPDATGEEKGKMTDDKVAPVVSQEHSYVKASSSIPTDVTSSSTRSQISDKDVSTTDSATTKERFASEELNKRSLSTSDEIIHGVGMSPDHATTTTGISSLENGQEVCNVVTVGKDGEAVKKSTYSPPPTINSSGKTSPSTEISSHEKPETASTEEHTLEEPKNKKEEEKQPATDVEDVKEETKLAECSQEKVDSTETVDKRDDAVDKTADSEHQSVTKAASTELVSAADSKSEPSGPNVKDNDVVDVIATSAEKQINETQSTSGINKPEKTMQPDVTMAKTEALSTQTALALTVDTSPVVCTSPAVDTSALPISKSVPAASQPSLSAVTSPSGSTVEQTTSATTIVQSSLSQPETNLQTSTSVISQKSVAKQPEPPTNTLLTTSPSSSTQADMTTNAVPAGVPSAIVSVGQPSTYPPPIHGAVQHPHQQSGKTKKPLLIKEQPLLLQDLLDEEKKEQERAKREKLSQAMMQQPGVIYPLPAVDVDKVEVDKDRILQAKVKVLSEISQVIKGNATTPAPPDGANQSGQMTQHPVGPATWHHPPTGPHAMHGQGMLNPPLVGTDAEDQQRRSAQYEEWLYQHQSLLQIQVKALEQAAKQHRSTKQALTKKQRQSKKSGEFTPIDAQTLNMVNRQQLDTQQQLDEVRKEQVRHSELVHSYNMKHGTVQYMPTMAGNAAPMCALPQQPSQPGEMPHMVQPPFQRPPQPHSMIRQPSVPGNLPLPGCQQTNSQTQSSLTLVLPSSHQTVSSASGGVAITTPVSSALVSFSQQAPHAQAAPSITTQQNVPGGMPMQHQSQEALLAQLQKIPGVRQMNPAQIQQLVMQHGAVISIPSTSSYSAPSSQPHPPAGSPKQLLPPGSIVPGSNPSHLNTQVMIPMSFGVRSTAPGQIDPLRGHLLPAQVASVNVNVGGNMATTQGSMMRPGGHPGASFSSGNNIDPASFMQMQHMVGQPQLPMQLPEKKPKRRRKKKKETTTGENVTIDPHFIMTQGMMSENPVMQMTSAGLQARLTTPTPMLMTSSTTSPYNNLPTSGLRPPFATQHASVAIETPPRQHGPTLLSSNSSMPPFPLASHVTTPSPLSSSAPTSSTPKMVSTPQCFAPAFSNSVQFSATLGTPAQTTHSIIAASTTSQQSNRPPTDTTGSAPLNAVATTVSSTSIASTRPLSGFPATPQPGETATEVVRSAGGARGSSSGLLVAQQPVAANTIKKEFDSSQTHLLKSELSTHFPSSAPGATPPRFSGLTESELEIIMATDPDSRSTATTPDSVNRAAPSPQSNRPPLIGTPNTPDETAKRPKKELVMSEKSLSLIDDTITNVIRDGVDFEGRLEAAKATGTPAVPPAWMRDPKPTKFPPKPPTPVSQMQQKPFMQMGGFGQPMFPPHSLNTNHQELLRYMLKTGNGPPPHHAVPSSPMGLSSFGGVEKKEYDMSPDHLKKQMEVMGSPYYYKMEDASKKKRSRPGSKDKDGKEKGKKRKKKKDNRQDEPGFPQDSSQIPPELMAMQMHRTFGDDQTPGKPPVQWKPLPLLPLVEPDIKINYSLCMPKGTGLAQSKSLLEGTFGNATLRGLPDYYDLLTCSDPFIYMNPPTPPSSLPPSPKRERLGSLDEVKGEPGSHQQHVKVPDSLPTPPHQGPESVDDIAAMSIMSEAEVILPSSPEVEDEKDDSSFIPLARSVAHKEDPTMTYQVASPVIPVLPRPGKSDIMDEGDEVAVTISFKDATSSKFIKKSLTQLSRTLETSIVSFKMEGPEKTIKTEKDGEGIGDSKKDIKSTVAGVQGPSSQDHPVVSQRRCFYCNQLVTGNGVRKPLFGDHLQEEDTIFCNKQCYFGNEFGKAQASVPVSKKKWKASQVYQRHTVKIDIASLISANPDPEFVSTRGRMGSVATDTYEDGQMKPADGKSRGRARRRGSTGPGEEGKTAAKRWKGIKWKKWSIGVTVVKSTNHKAPADVDALVAKYGSSLKPPADIQDSRTCVLCDVSGDGDTKRVARLLNLDVDQWVHLNCALWSAEVYETQGGALINVDLAVRNGLGALCNLCQKKGATIHCNRSRCSNTYHCECALRCGCHFYKDKTVVCPTHAMAIGGQAGTPQHHDQLKSLAVFRKVYVQRKETKQIASIMQQGELTQGEKNYILRVGALMFHAVGQLSTHQMAQFHRKTAIFPVGYKATRIYWSSNNTRKRCKYMCMITEKDGAPWFTTRYQAVASRPKNSDKKIQGGEWMEMSGKDLNDEWSELLQQLANLRNQQKMLKLFPAYINGENVFGLTSPVVCRILESLPNIELCANYKFRYGRSPLFELPLAVNPTGCARAEPHIKHSRKKPHTLISNLISEYYESTGIGDASSSLYGKHFVHSKSSQYRRMKQEWRNNVNLARSRIQGLGLFAGRDIEPGTMVIEYIGEIIRSEVADKREKKYEAANRGVYMFRLDSDYIVDATVTGGPARYINHSCNPNCVAEVVNFEKEKKIMIISNRLILSGEELNYDYKFDFEDDGNKIPCLCGATNCRKWMN